MLPTPNNNFLQIVQSAGYVAILYEMMHEVRVIPFDGRAHSDPKVRGYMGDSRGHWEGDTLVIDTTNFTGTGYSPLKQIDTGKVAKLTQAWTLSLQSDWHLLQTPVETRIKSPRRFPS